MPSKSRCVMTYHDRFMSKEERWRSSRFDDMSKLWELTDIEKQKMRQFQFRVEDVDHWKNDPYELVRILKEFHGDVAMAEHILRYTVDWRKQNNMETHMERYGTPDPRFHHYPIGILEGKDKDGDPIYCNRFGSADSSGLLEEFGSDGIIDYMLFLYEYISRREFWRPYEKREGHRVKSLTAVVDLDGLDEEYIMKQDLLPLLQRMARIAQDCYAGTAKRIILVRAPPIFRAVWAMAKYYFDPHIREKMIIADLADIHEYMDPCVLPDCVFPGVGQGKSMPGFFENIHWEAGPIPSRKQAKKQLRKQKSKSLQYPRRTPSARSSKNGAVVVVSVTTTTVFKGSWDQELSGPIVQSF
ncbi:SEC14-like protein 5 [Seminavis robusta]|uniref:SEC14-like protein 5 n=1 Tax=Seminavis robusta TaxID=568900 RepID=A0A9N8E0J4_9STRA|nr:SEC14-like protein 5 [Seminavis robusta]|eukprot:Sro414_g138340.1 SEC14-like protein 5 (356) ;mRNA; f:53386-54644